MNSIAPLREVWTPSNDEERGLVQEELERILADPRFGTSRRYPALLRYVVEKTLIGDTEHLKERTLGIEVFHRPTDYDTNEDPVVRVTAGEVRKRIAQFYRERQKRGPLEIALPLGGYVPQFLWIALFEEVVPLVSGAPPIVSGPGTRNHDADIPADPFSDNPHNIGRSTVQPQTSTAPRHSLLIGIAIGVAIMLLFSLASSLIHRSKASTPLMEVWNPLLNNQDMVLISVGRPHTDGQEVRLSPETTIGEHFLLPEFRISLSAVQAASQITGFLQTQKKHFRIQDAYSNTLQDLHPPDFAS